MIKDALLSAKGLVFGYDRHKPVLNGLDLVIQPGQKIGLMGANGSGKTTLFRCLTGLENVISGAITFEGQAVVSGQDFYRLRRNTGYLLQDADNQLIFPEVLEDVSFGPLNLDNPPDKSRELARISLEKVGLTGFERRLVHELSGGEKKLVALAGILAMQPRLLLLDEPLNELDEEAAGRITRLFAEMPSAVIVSSHDGIFLKKICDSIIFMKDGLLHRENTLNAPL